MLQRVRYLVLAGALLLTSAAAAGTTQIVVQWTTGTHGITNAQFFDIQGVFDDHAGQYGYDSDGNDVGGGLTNFFLYAEDARVADVVRDVIAMRNGKLLPDGMRIGVAVYKDVARKDWTFRPAYPAGLKSFDIVSDTGH